ncbi:hypothetical protein PIB30_054792 [Stylosanthes scabra]|uniref:Uncharacterized protein n=1 Tax=Stylosanthes scabra TaxID=79078 RepID=A0ABU6SJ38_9FABA|nr:hypothetical protein [Stylosanthes scabra]
MLPGPTLLYPVLQSHPLKLNFSMCTRMQSLRKFKLNLEGRLTVPQNKAVKRNHTSIRSSYDEPVLDERGVLYKGLLDRSIEISEFGSEYKGLAAILHRAYDKAYAEMIAFKAKEKGDKTVMTHQEGSLDGMNDLHSPTHVKSRGCPRKRLGSTFENKLQVHRTRRKEKL